VNEKDVFGTATVFRIRSAETLICRIRIDHMELNRLWERCKKGPIDVPDIDEAVGLICSIREELRALEDLRKEDIEGFCGPGWMISGETFPIRNGSMDFSFPFQGKYSATFGG